MSGIAERNNESAISFWNHKINYNRRLGSGTYGDIYEVVERPENEKGCFSYLFPYLYDRWVPVNEQNKKPTEFCIKIYKTSVKVLKESGDAAAKSFFQPSIEQRTNKILKKHELSGIIFHKTRSIYSQFKTRIYGQNLTCCAHTFKFEWNYNLRRSFVVFLRKILKAPIKFSDLNGDNIMYDEKCRRWEIVDGRVWEIHSQKREVGTWDNIDELFWQCLRCEKRSQYIFDGLARIARVDQPYTRDIDQELLKKPAKKDLLYHQE